MPLQKINDEMYKVQLHIDPENGGGEGFSSLIDSGMTVDEIQKSQCHTESMKLNEHVEEGNSIMYCPSEHEYWDICKKNAFEIMRKNSSSWFPNKKITNEFIQEKFSTQVMVNFDDELSYYNTDGNEIPPPRKMTDFDANIIFDFIWIKKSSWGLGVSVETVLVKTQRKNKTNLKKIEQNFF